MIINYTEQEDAQIKWHVLYCKYSQLPLRRTCSGPAPTVCLREVSALEGDEIND